MLALIVPVVSVSGTLVVLIIGRIVYVRCVARQHTVPLPPVQPLAHDREKQRNMMTSSATQLLHPNGSFYRQTYPSEASAIYEPQEYLGNAYNDKPLPDSTISTPTLSRSRSLAASVMTDRRSLYSVRSMSTIRGVPHKNARPEIVLPAPLAPSHQSQRPDRPVSMIDAWITTTMDPPDLTTRPSIRNASSRSTLGSSRNLLRP